MKEPYCDLQIIFPSMPASCDYALMAAARSASDRKRCYSLRSAFVLALTLILAVGCTAGAAFYPQIIGWFTSQYGANWGTWLQEGRVAETQFTAEVKGAVFTVDEVLVRDRGLYVLGSIRPEEGYAIADYDTSKAPLDDKTLRYVHCGLERIGVDGGAMLAPGTWGYIVEENSDGSIEFSIEVEDGTVVEPGSEYTIEMYAISCGANADGSVKPEDIEETMWSFTVNPEN